MGDETKAVLRDNVRRLIGLQAGESGVQRLIDKGFANGTAQRVLGGQTSVGLDVVEKLAAAFDVAPWKLLAPDLGGTVPAGIDQLSPHESMLVGILRQRGKDAARQELVRLQGESTPFDLAPTLVPTSTRRP